MSEREVKLTARGISPLDPQSDAMQEVRLTDWSRDPEDGDRPKHIRECSASDLWAAGHDAAPDDATDALEGLVWAIHNLRHGPNSEYSVYARYVDTYLGALGKANDGAALIRQAMDRETKG